MKTIAQVKEKIKAVQGFVERKDIYTTLIIVLVGFAGFGLGRLSAIEEQRPEVRILGNAGAVFTSGQSISGRAEGGLLVGSKNGSKYHYPWCSGAQRMKEENKIWFESVEEAERAGYTPAANCKGL